MKELIKTNTLPATKKLTKRVRVRTHGKDMWVPYDDSASEEDNHLSAVGRFIKNFGYECSVSTTKISKSEYHHVCDYK